MNKYDINSTEYGYILSYQLRDIEIYETYLNLNDNITKK
jgi:hypothetical protein